MYPNPTNSEVTLSIEKTNDSFSYSLYNTFGQLLEEESFQSNKKVISVARYTAGIYFIVVKSKALDIEATVRIIKE